MKVGEFVGLLFHSRTQAHIFHLKTNDYAQHKALNEYYSEIIPLVDKFVESYQGKYCRITGYSNYSFSENPKESVKYFNNLIGSINKFKVKDKYLQNIWIRFMNYCTRRFILYH